MSATTQASMPAPIGRAVIDHRGSRSMWVLILEAVLALALLIFIVWWTMAGSARQPSDETAKDE